METFFLEQAAMSLGNIEYRNERIGVHAVDGIAELDDFQAGYDGIEYLRLFPAVGAFAIEQRNGPAHFMDDAVRYGFMLGRDDEQALRFIQTIRDDIDHLIGDEIGHERIHGAIPGKHEARAAQDEQVEKHDDFTHGKG